jgi:hypothetical protein
MKDSYKLLILGSSDVIHRDSDDQPTVPELLKAELQRRFPQVAWLVDSSLLYPTARMREMAARHVDSSQPDLVFLSMGTNTFVERSVEFSLKRRLPLVYPLASRLIRTGKAAGGGRAEGSPGALGLLFRVPRTFARRLFGMAPLIDPEVAFRATEEMFELLGASGIPVVVRLAEGNVQQAEQRAAAAELTSHYNEAVREWCRRFGFPTFRLSDEMGEEYRRTPDGLHGDDAARTYEGVRAAELIGARLGLTEAALGDGGEG